LLKPEAPYVGTGLESKVARDSRTMVISKTNGKVIKVSATEIIV
jgi:DNA-directed RNA polymerase subunit beta